MHADALLTASEGARLLRIRPHLVFVWRTAGKISPVDKRGRSPLYRWGDLVRVERETRTSGYSHRAA